MTPFHVYELARVAFYARRGMAAMSRQNLTWEGHESLPLAEGARVALVAAYELARADASAGAVHTAEACPQSRCRYCGRPRTHFRPGSRLDGHPACVVTPAFMRFVLDVVETGTRCKDVEKALDVSAKTLRAWFVRALDLRDAERRASAR